MTLFFICALIFVVVYQLWFWPILNQTPEILHISEESMNRYLYIGLAFSIVAEILIFRDLYLREIKDKSGWVLGLLMCSAVAAPLYYFKYARHPRRAGA